MNAYELADKLEKRELEAMEYGFDKELFEATELLRQQADKLHKYELRNTEQRKRIAHLEMLVTNRNEILDKLNLTTQTKPALYINEETLRGGNGGDTFWDTEVSWWPEDGFVPLYEK